MTSRIFVLSPAHAGGRRAALLTRAGASFELARRLHIGDATLGEVFTFCSGLYFRGKLAYARKFAQPPPALEGVQVITPTRGLLPADHPMSLDLLHEFSTVAVDPDEPLFAEPLVRSIEKLAVTRSDVVLLGSIATAKYVDCLLPVLGDRLLFPRDFVGRGDMSRGALMLRCAAASEELPYIAVAGAVLRGQRAKRAMWHPSARKGKGA